MLEIDRIYNMDCLEGLRLLDDNSIDCCVTSPPYWGLRDYGTAKWEGGNSSCNHQRDNKITNDCSTGQKSVEGGIGDAIYKDICQKCGARRIDKQFGLEKAPEEYVNHLVQVFHEVKRVLKNKGTVWLNLRDSYAGSGKGIGSEPDPKWDKARNDDNKHKTNWKELSLKPKDLVGIPWRTAFALQGDGWWLRQDIIWSKPNPMPESVTDRCTKSHEYIFLLTKSKSYYYDAEAIKEPSIKVGVIPGGHKYADDASEKYIGGCHTAATLYNKSISEFRNKRSVWTVTTKPFSGAHFATFPEDLIEPMIKAGCPKEGIVLDPFIGAGTTALVSRKLLRHFIGFELNPEYCRIAEKRLACIPRRLDSFLG